jgi:hypothetical protein
MICVRSSRTCVRLLRFRLLVARRHRPLHLWRRQPLQVAGLFRGEEAADPEDLGDGDQLSSWTVVDWQAKAGTQDRCHSSIGFLS